jgi:hypothetical protein
MAANTTVMIPLTVVSVDNTNTYQSYAETFNGEFMTGIRANQNPAEGVSMSGGQVVLTNNTSSIITDVIFNIPVGGQSMGANPIINGLYYYTLTKSSTTYTFKLYGDPNYSYFLASGSVTGTGALSIYLTQQTESGVSGNVLINASSYSADITNGTMTIHGVGKAHGLQVNGNSQFVYTDLKQVQHKYTVVETITDINYYFENGSFPS